MSNANVSIPRLSRQLLDLLLPPTCLSCRVVTATTQGLCADCWTDLEFVSDPHCACCGHPFEFETEPGLLCGQCTVQKPVYEMARAPLVYGEKSRSLLLGFKHGDRTDLAPFLARLIQMHTGDVLAECDLVVPVPLHWTRLFSRRYNQAGLIAAELGLLSGCKVDQRCLRRVRRTGTQGGLSAKGRHQNLVGAFQVPPAFRDKLRGKRIALVDDVFTTGATARACAKVLLKAGASHVRVLTVARVIKER